MTPPLPTLSREFRLRAFTSILAILLFIVVYLAMLAASLWLVYAAGLLAWAIVTNFTHWITLVFALGLILSAGLLVYFMIKFLFQRTETRVETDLHITAADEPELFALIEEVVGQLDVKRPKKVFLTQDVNASVVYNSTFWSMFFPVRKNLRIGLGLLNAVTREELRAVIAHEFGHFSQRSMAIGSYVYQVNHILFNLVNDDSSFINAASHVASISGYIYPFVWVALKITEGARWILARLYGVVNKSYLGLSREMEYHADAVAASIGGGPALATGLRRLDLAQQSYNLTLQVALDEARGGKQITNLYPIQATELRERAERDQIPFSGPLPLLTGADYGRYLKSQIDLDQQWASHPETEDRIAHLELRPEELHSADGRLAIELLQDQRARERELTAILLQTNPDYAAATDSLPEGPALEAYRVRQRNSRFPDYFNGYYDHHALPVGETAEGEDPAFVPSPAPAPAAPEEPLFSDVRVADLDRLVVVEHDLSLLEQIGQKESGVKTFDYAGRKYRKTEAATLADKLRGEVEELRARIAGYDREILEVARRGAALNGDPMAFDRQLAAFRTESEAAEKGMAEFQAVRDAAQFVEYTLPIEQIREHLREFEPKLEAFRRRIEALLEEGKYASHATRSDREVLERYLREKRKIFVYDAYVVEALNLLGAALQAAETVLFEAHWETKREFYGYLAELVRTAEEAPSVSAAQGQKI